MTDTAQDTRRCKAQSLIDRGVTQFAVRPMDGPEETRQELMVIAGEELKHALPCCDADVAKPPAVEELTAIADVNIRSVQSTAGNTPVGLMAKGSKLTFLIDENSTWKTIAEGTYQGRYVSATYLKKV